MTKTYHLDDGYVGNVNGRRQSRSPYSSNHPEYGVGDKFYAIVKDLILDYLTWGPSRQQQPLQQQQLLNTGRVTIDPLTLRLQPLIHPPLLAHTGYDEAADDSPGKILVHCPKGASSKSLLKPTTPKGRISKDPKYQVANGTKCNSVFRCSEVVATRPRTHPDNGVRRTHSGSGIHEGIITNLDLIGEKRREGGNGKVEGNNDNHFITKLTPDTGGSDHRSSKVGNKNDVGYHSRGLTKRGEGEEGTSSYNNQNFGTSNVVSRGGVGGGGGRQGSSYSFINSNNNNSNSNNAPSSQNYNSVLNDGTTGHDTNPPNDSYPNNPNSRRDPSPNFAGGRNLPNYQQNTRQEGRTGRGRLTRGGHNFSKHLSPYLSIPFLLAMALILIGSLLLMYFFHPCRLEHQMSRASGPQNDTGIKGTDYNGTGEDLLGAYYQSLEEADDEMLTFAAGKAGELTGRAKEFADRVRLSPNIKPLHYEVELWPRMPDTDRKAPDNFVFSGKVKVYFDVVQNFTRRVTLHAKENLLIGAQSIKLAHHPDKSDIYDKMNSLRKRRRAVVVGAEGTEGDAIHNSAEKKVILVSQADAKLGLNAMGNNLTDGAAVVVIDVLGVEREKLYDFIHVDSRQILQPGSCYSLEMSFESPLKKDLSGLYLSSYQYEGNTEYLAITQFEPTDARKTFPCFDEPALKATFDVSLIRLGWQKSVSNAPMKESGISVGNDWFKDTFHTSPLMSTYLLAASVNNFIVIEGEKSKSGVKFSLWVRKELAHQADYAIKIAPKVLDFFEEFFQVKYPLAKMDMMAVPDFSAGAMENWGLITYREAALLFDPKFSSIMNKEKIASVIVHEISHQWFGNVVTMKWWDDLWLNEGFASYMEYLGVTAIHPEWDVNSILPIKDLQNTFSIDSLSYSHPIHVPVYNPVEIGQIFDTISYSKGSAIIRMMNYILGDEAFKNGLKDYLNTLKYKNAGHDDLWYHLQKATHSSLNLKEVMDTWILQMGYPYITVERNYKTGQVDLIQQYYKLNKTATWSLKYISPYKYTWYVPFTYVTKDNPTSIEHVWLNRTNAKIDGPSQITSWVLGNVNQTGLYRVMYDKTNWDLLTAQLMTDHKVINIINRAQILDDLFNFARSGYVSYDLAMQSTKYLIYETDYLPWYTIINSLDYIGEMLRRRISYGSFKVYMQMILYPQYRRIGWKSYSERDLKLSSMQEDILSAACFHEIIECILECKRQYRELMQSPGENKIMPHIRSTVYCNAISHGNLAEWDFAFNQFQKEQVAQEKLRFMVSLACSREPWILSRLMHYSFNESIIRAQDVAHLIRAVALNPVGRYISWSFILNNWDKIIEVWGNNYFALETIVSVLAYGRNTKNELDEVLSFMKKNKKKLKSERFWNQGIEKVLINMQWLEKNENMVTGWLDKLIPYFKEYKLSYSNS